MKLTESKLREMVRGILLKEFWDDSDGYDRSKQENEPITFLDKRPSAQRGKIRRVEQKISTFEPYADLPGEDAIADGRHEQGVLDREYERIKELWDAVEKYRSGK